MEKLRGLERQVYSEQQSYVKEFEKRTKQVKNIRNELETVEAKQRYNELVGRLKQIEKSRLVKQPYVLW